MPQYQGVWTLPVAARLQSNQQWVTDPLYRNTTLLLQADNAANGAQNNTFLDSSSNNFTITRNGNTTQGTFTPFSATGWGNYFDGTGDYLSVASATALNLSTGDLTVEGWIYMNALPAANAPVASKFNAASPYTGWTLGINSSGYPYIWFGTTYLITSISTVAIGVWHHLALVRSGTTVTLYVNGVSVGTATSSANLDNTGTLTIGIEAGNANGLNGYVSNSRIVKGTAVYTANFNPSTSPLTAITNTSLLTCQSNRFVDNSTNAFAITVNGNVSVQAFSPFAPQYQWTAPVIGGSAFFDGTGDFLATPSGQQVSFGTGDFTIEAWMYFNSVVYPDQSGIMFGEGVGWTLYIFPTARLQWGNISPQTPANLLTGSTTLVPRQWYHVAITRQSGTVRMWLNGALDGSVTNAVDFSASGVFKVGVDHSTNYFSGYISSLRILKGTALYTTAFTPPTAPPTAITNTSLLLNFTNAGIYDGTLKNNLETVGNAQVSTSVVKYGTGSMAFDGTGDWCLVPSSQNFNMGTGDWTVECWAYASASTARGLFQITTGFLNSTLTGIGVGISTTSGNPWRVYHGTTNTDTTLNATIGVWNHVAFVRFNGAVRLYINGASVYSATDTSNLSTYTFLTVGAWYDSSFPWNGYIDDFRITKGIARYTANFTPPTVALPRQ